MGSSEPLAAKLHLNNRQSPVVLSSDPTRLSHLAQMRVGELY